MCSRSCKTCNYKVRQGFLLITEITLIHFGINSVGTETHNSESEEVNSFRVECHGLSVIMIWHECSTIIFNIYI